MKVKLCTLVNLWLIWRIVINCILSIGEVWREESCTILSRDYSVNEIYVHIHFRSIWLATLRLKYYKGGKLYDDSLFDGSCRYHHLPKNLYLQNEKHRNLILFASCPVFSGAGHFARWVWLIYCIPPSHQAQIYLDSFKGLGIGVAGENMYT